MSPFIQWQDTIFLSVFCVDIQDTVPNVWTASDTLCCYGHSPAAVNDGLYSCNDHYGWHSTYVTGPATHWLEVQFTNHVVQPTQYRLKSRDGCYPSYPSNNYELKGSNDEVTWTSLDNGTQLTSVWVTEAVTTTNYYRYLRFYFYVPAGTSYVEIYEIEIDGAYVSISTKDLQDLIPATYSASDTLCCYGHAASKINDGLWGCNDNWGWHSTYSPTPTTHWLGVSWPGKNIFPYSYSLKSRDGCSPSYPATNYNFQGSIDNVNWVTLDTSTASTTNWVTRNVSSVNAYQYFRVFFNNVTPYVEIYEAMINAVSY